MRIERLGLPFLSGLAATLLLMTGEEPRDVFLHYWGRGPAAALARALKSALDTQPAHG
jgi:Domain of Unknown Function (DUF1259)